MQPWLNKYPDFVDWNTKFEPTDMRQFFDKSVSVFGDKSMMDFMGKKYTFNELNDYVNKIACGLQHLGVEQGDKVGLFFPNCPYYPMFYYATLKIGAVVVNFNPLYADNEIGQLIEQSEVKIMATLDLTELFEKVLKHKEQLQNIIVCPMDESLPKFKSLMFNVLKRKDIADPSISKRTFELEDIMVHGDTPDLPKIDALRDTAVIQFTGGTTGIPKGAELSHANLTTNVKQIVEWFPNLKPGEGCSVAVLPFFHVFAMTGLLNYGVHQGREAILLPRFNLKQLLKTIDHHKPVLFGGVPTIFTAINNAKITKKYDLSCMKYCISGGAALPVEVKRKFEEISGCTLVEGYGLSETSPVACVNPPHGENKAGSIGLPVPGTTITITDIEDHDKILPHGEKGEICISGPQVMKGYYNKPEATAESIRDGRFYTGDIGYLDDDGYTFIVDRKKEMIIASGYNIYPRVVEEAIYQHPCILECAVIGIPDEYRGESVKACLVLKDKKKLTPDELTDFLQDKISPIEMPKHFEFFEELPKSPIGKILKKELVARENDV